MATAQYEVNPRLIAALTGQPLSDIPDNPDVSMLPGKYVQLMEKKRRVLIEGRATNPYDLICGHCGHRGKYDLGLIVYNIENVDPTMSADKPNYESALENIQATGYFRCKHCNGAGKWEFHDKFAIFKIMAMVLSESHRENPRVSAGLIRLYDGSTPRWTSDAEDQYLSILMKDDGDAYRWNRLGNLYYQGGRPELAIAAYEKSLQIDPAQVESHFSIGILLFQTKALEEAAYHSRMTLVHASNYDRMEAIQLRELLANGLRHLCDMHLHDNSIPLIPSQDEMTLRATQREVAADQENRTLRMLDMELDPNEIESFYPLAEMYMHHKKDEIPIQEQAMNKTDRQQGKHRAIQVQAASEERAKSISMIGLKFGIPVETKVGRPEELGEFTYVLMNSLKLTDAYAPCPCDSGKKYKFCCGQRVKSKDIEAFIRDFGNSN